MWRRRDKENLVGSCCLTAGPSGTLQGGAWRSANGPHVSTDLSWSVRGRSYTGPWRCLVVRRLRRDWRRRAVAKALEAKVSRMIASRSCMSVASDRSIALVLCLIGSACIGRSHPAALSATWPQFRSGGDRSEGVAYASRQSDDLVCAPCHRDRSVVAMTRLPYRRIQSSSDACVGADNSHRQGWISRSSVARPVVPSRTGVGGRKFPDHGSASTSISLSAWSSGEWGVRFGSSGRCAVPCSAAVR